MSITKLYAGVVGDPLNTSGPQLAVSVNNLIDAHVSHLKALPTAAKAQTDTVYNVISFYDGWAAAAAGPRGGGRLVWMPDASKSLHNGVTHYAPEALLAWNGTQASLATLRNWSGTGTGVFARILDGFISPEMAGALGDGATIDTLAMQSAIDVAATTTKTVLADNAYKVGASALSETYDNAGAAIPASDCAVVLRKGVNLIGRGRSKSKIFTDDAGLFILAIIAPDSQCVKGFEIYSNWVAGNGGAGHGVFTLSTASGADNSLKNLTIEDLYVHNVASYGISVQNGAPVGCSIKNCETFYTGADGFDLKARNDVSTLPESNVASGLTARRFNMRVDGSAGLDIRGVWSAENITVKDFGENAAKSYVGIRFRTKPLVTDPYNKAAAKSTLFSFNIKSDNVGECYGVQSGSDDVKISGGTIEAVDYGVYLLGNANGSATRNTVHATTVIGATIQGFRNTSGVTSCDLTSCYAVDCATGFRIEGVGTKLASCEASGGAEISISSGAAPSTVISPDCKFGSDSQLSVYRAASGRVAIEAKGSATHIDLEFYPKGTSGKLRFSDFTANADAPVIGYVTIKTLDGSVRKLAVIA
jgi:hypothetical protein